jgi:hypothetical protein
MSIRIVQFFSAFLKTTADDEFFGGKRNTLVFSVQRTLPDDKGVVLSVKYLLKKLKQGFF